MSKQRGLLVAFNGPPGSGKDTLAGLFMERLDLIQRNRPANVMSLGQPLKWITAILAGIDPMAANDPVVYYSLKKHKLEDSTLFSELNFRQAMIDVAEKSLKPVYGTDMWVHILMQKARVLLEAGGIVLIPDLGFQEEAEKLANYCDVFNSDFAIMKVYRDGYNFDNDSRNYVCDSSAWNMCVWNNYENPEQALDDLWKDINLCQTI